MGDDVIGVYPDCAEPLAVFSELATQWRIGMAGPTGLCYEALYPMISRKCKTDEEWDRMFGDIRVMEREALRVMHEKP